MKIRILLYIGVLYIGSSCAMEQQQQQSIAPVAVSKEASPNVLLSIVSSQGKSNPVYMLMRGAWQYSRLLQTMIESSERRDAILPIDLPDEQVYFIVELLSFIELYKQEHNAMPPQNIVIDAIKRYAHNFTTISFIDALHAINFFDIPITFDAIVTIKQPIALPRCTVGDVMYNKQLAHVFGLAKQAVVGHEQPFRIGNECLWQLFGSMIYPHCLRYPEIDRMLTFVESRKCVENLILGAYVQQHPMLYGMACSQSIKVPHCQLVAINTDKTRAACASTNGILQLWAIDEIRMRCLHAQHIHLDNNGSIVQTVVYSPHGNYIALQVSDGSIYIIDAYSGVIVQVVRGYSCCMDVVSFNHDSRLIASVSHDKQILVRDVLTGELRQIMTGLRYPIFSLQWSCDGETILSGSKDGRLCFWNVKTGRLLHVHKGVAARFAFCLSPDGNSVCSSGLLGNDLCIIDIKTGLITSVLENINSHKISSVLYSPDGSVIAAVCEDGFFRLWDVHTSLLRYECNTRSSFQHIAFSPNGRTIVSSYGEKHMQLWDVFSGRRIGTSIAVASPIIALDFNRDGRQIIARLIDETVVIYGYDSLRQAIIKSFKHMSQLIMPVPVSRLCIKACQTPLSSRMTAENSESSSTESSDDREDDPVVLPAPLPNT